MRLLLSSSMEKYLRHIILTLSLLVLTACSGTNKAYLDSISYIFDDSKLSYTQEQIANSPYDLVLVSVDDEVSAALALSFIDGEKYRWVSEDEVVITIHHGVIVQTEGLSDDLHYTSNIERNPLAGDDVLVHRWERFVDIENTVFGAPVSSTWRVEGESVQLYFDKPINTIKIVETVTFSDSSPFFNPGLSWENIYYLDATTKYLLSTRQKYHPEGHIYDLVYLSRAHRALEAKEG